MNNHWAEFEPHDAVGNDLRPSASFSAETLRWRVGDETKPDPMFILVVNNIALPDPANPGAYRADLAATGFGSRDKTLFTDTAEYIARNILGRLPNQIDQVLSDSPDVLKIRIWSMYVFGLVANEATNLIEEDATVGSTIIAPRRDAVVRMLAYLGVDPDIVFVVTNSPTHNRAAAYGTTDDDARGGIATTLNGQPLVHRFHHLIPGMAAIHTATTGMTAAHEFGHAFSSYTNGYVTDLYVDGGNALNRLSGRPIPATFAEYGGRTFASDATRDGLGYPATWSSYRSELLDPARPAIMDDYRQGSIGGFFSRHDALTKAYQLDRVAAKVRR